MGPEETTRKHPVFSLGLLFCLLALSGCADTETLAPTRGYILISLDTLGAGHLGCYGYERNTSPFLDSLAARATLFENAVAQYPITLSSHMSIFTGLYPAEHAVGPFNSTLSPAIETIPEVFQRNGFRTAGYTEGGLAAGHFGFSRGFDEFSDKVGKKETTNVERTFARGLEFLKSLDSDDRFFLFLHTYSVHGPYWPPEPYRDLYWKTAPNDDFPPTVRNLSRVKRGYRTISDEEIDYWKSLYDAGINYLDDMVRDLFADLEQVGLLEDVTIVITSDHGEQFMQHGSVGHGHVYHHDLHVPLIVLHPQQSDPRRVQSLVQSIDISPTLYELAGIRPEGGLSGLSLVPYLEGESATLHNEAYAERHRRRFQGSSVYRQEEDRILQFIRFSPEVEDDGGSWFTRSGSFDTEESKTSFRVKSFHEPRSMLVSVDGEPYETFDLNETWTTIDLEFPDDGIKRTITLSTDQCSAPELGGVSSMDCLSFKVQGDSLERTELYDVTNDPWGATDLSRTMEGLSQTLDDRLQAYRWEPVAPPETKELDPELRDRLEALGYVK